MPAVQQPRRDIAAEGLQEMYLKDRGRRTQGLLEDFTGIDCIELDY